MRAPSTGTAGRTADSLVLVRLVNDRGDPIVGAAVAWSVLDGGGTVTPVGPTTGADGIAAAEWRLGIASASQSLNVAAEGVPSIKLELEAKAFRAVTIATGQGFTCGLDSLGDAWCWGRISYGLNRPVFGDRPVKVDSGHALVELVAGALHACARSATTTYCWGYGFAVGRGGVDANGYAPSAPVDGGHQFTSLSATVQSSSTCGVDAAGQGWCWGTDVDGNLGSAGAYHLTLDHPVAVDQGALQFSQISLGYDHACGLATDGAAWCWGRDRGGKLGDTLHTSGVLTTPNAVTTSLRFTRLSVGDDTSCGSTAQGETWCWGADTFGPTYTEGPRPWLATEPGFSTPALDYERYVTIKNGRPYLWGRMDIYDYSPAGFIHPTPGELPGGVTGAVQVTASWLTLCALRVDGVVLCWGYTSGSDSGTRAVTPVAIPEP